MLSLSDADARSPDLGDPTVVEIPRAKGRLMMQLPLRLELFVAGISQMSVEYAALIEQVLDEVGDSDFTVIDVTVEPQRAEDARVAATPQLVRWFPTPTRRILGWIDDETVLRHHLEAGMLLSLDSDGGGSFA